MAYRLKIDSRNRLVVEETHRTKGKVSSETTFANKDVEKVVLDGKWSLTEDHNLKLHVIGSESQAFGKTVILSGDVQKTSGSGLSFRVRQSENISGLRSGTIELNGKWASDGNNRITFKVARARGKYDTLRFQGVWHINKNNEVVYKREKTALKRSTKTSESLLFRGFWDLGEKRIVYRLEGATDSFFSFNAAVQSKSLRASDGAVRYQVGVKYSQGKVRRSVKQTVSIYGKWKLGKGFGLAFEIAYSGRKKQLIHFSADKLFWNNRKITFSLKDEKGKPLGFEVEFRKAIKDDAEIFFALSRQGEDSRVMGGVRIRF